MNTEPVPVGVPGVVFVAWAGAAANSSPHAATVATTGRRAGRWRRWGTVGPPITTGATTCGPPVHGSRDPQRLGSYRWMSSREVRRASAAEPRLLQEGVLRRRERAGGDVGGICGSRLAELGAEVGVLLDEA